MVSFAITNLKTSVVRVIAKGTSEILNRPIHTPVLVPYEILGVLGNSIELDAISLSVILFLEIRVSITVYTTIPIWLSFIYKNTTCFDLIVIVRCIYFVYVKNY
jgi:hypothetical protein